VAQSPSLSNNYGRSAARFPRRTDSDLQILPERHQEF
jgi:hypothetical protein